VVFTIPKRLRVHARFDRKLLGKLSSCAWACLKAEVRRMLDRDDVVPGMIAAIQTHGEILPWHPHLHSLVTCGAFTPDGDFLELPEFDMDRLLVAWQEAVFTLYLTEGKIEPEVVENMRTWQHSGFSIDQSVLLQAGDQAGIERLVQYMVRCPLEPVSAGQGNRYWASCLQGRERCLSGFSQSAVHEPRSRHETEFPAPLATRFPGGIHSAHPAQGLSYDPIHGLVFQQVKGNAEEGKTRRGQTNGSKQTLRHEACSL
jgi:hypothetical protein